jgi:hypothetical protein
LPPSLAGIDCSDSIAGIDCIARIERVGWIAGIARRAAGGAGASTRGRSAAAGAG